MIRIYKDEDVDATVSIWRETSELAPPFLTEQFLDQGGDNIRNMYLAFAVTWVTELDDQVVGFISLIEGDAATEIGGLFRDPKYHGQGLSRAMVDKAVAEKGQLKVEVFKENIKGRRFYAAYGFCDVDEYFHEASGQATMRMSFSTGRFFTD